MKRADYLADPSVADFLTWAATLVGGSRPFAQSWTSAKWGPWRCQSLFDAYERYSWRFSVVLPGDSSPRRGYSFDDTVAVFNELRAALRNQDEAGLFLQSAIAVVEWGGVRQNVRRLRSLGLEALPNITAAARQLDPRSADTRQLDDVRYMNSGFSKIYSLLLDDFPIYDSRVACALTSLVSAYCRERGVDATPEPLALGIPPSHGRAVRDPSAGPVRFPRLWHGQPKAYAISNLKAAWLIGDLCRQGRFGEIPDAERGLALQSALFMVGFSCWRSDGA